MEVDPKRPTLYLRANNLWHDATVSVSAVAAPDPGEVDPTYFLLCRLKSSQVVACKLPVLGDPPGFEYAGIAFVVTGASDDVGTVNVEVMRDQDTPEVPPFDRPVYETVKLTRAAITSDVTIRQFRPIKAPGE